MWFSRVRRVPGSTSFLVLKQHSSLTANQILGLDLRGLNIVLSTNRFRGRLCLGLHVSELWLLFQDQERRSILLNHIVQITVWSELHLSCVLFCILGSKATQKAQGQILIHNLFFYHCSTVNINLLFKAIFITFNSDPCPKKQLAVLGSLSWVSFSLFGCCFKISNCMTMKDGYIYGQINR